MVATLIANGDASVKVLVFLNLQKTPHFNKSIQAMQLPSLLYYYMLELKAINESWGDGPLAM